MKTLKHFALAWVIACLSALTASATLVNEVSVYSTLDPQGHYDLSLAATINGVNSGYDFQEVGQRFVPAVSGTLSSIELALYGPAGAQVDVRLALSAAGDVPSASSLAVGTAIIPANPGSLSWPLGSFVPSSAISLNSGTVYWVVMSPHTDQSTDGWYYNNLGLIGRNAFRNTPGVPWRTANSTLCAYRVNVLVPEPGTSTLIAAGIGVLAALRRRARLRPR